ncbi:DUF3598 family protein [Calothrix sp. PCC 6303]|uniref:DUF3598 family protein n=1 Tax=Calothrix sp. PCC 6303 TaxID=1170562 RepID=UPI0002A02C64|nr:DUF3598 family protein [Calothrix sp. PCC 6303]AFZ04040.1 hypothetical protein Cal6303_5152 [Calothrix sp. PCC 6303]
MRSQWESLLQNLGVWQGSFTVFSPQGELKEDIPSRLTLETLDDTQSTVRLTLLREGKNDLVLDTSSLSRSLLFFENGAFSQGAMQFSPYGDFGGEFSFIHENRRLRFVQLFNNQSNLSTLTLIREHREGTTPDERPPLQVESLLGEWEGEGITIYPDLRSPVSFDSKMQLKLDKHQRLIQNTYFGSEKMIASTATINGSILDFDDNPENPFQVMMLPDGASATFPVKAQLRQPLFLEAGWLIEPNLRQRIIRTYDNKGEWVSLTLVTEKKVS